MQGVCRGRNFTAKWVITGGECNKLSPILAHLNCISILPAYRTHLASQACMCVSPPGGGTTGWPLFRAQDRWDRVGLGLSFQRGGIPVEKPEGWL